MIGYSDNAVVAIHNLGGCTKDKQNPGQNKGVNIRKLVDGLSGKLPESAFTQGKSPP